MKKLSALTLGIATILVAAGCSEDDRGGVAGPEDEAELPPAQILASFPSSPGRHGHGGAAWGGLVWQSEHGRSLIIEFQCDGTFRRTIPNPVAGAPNSDTGVGDLAYDPNTNTFWQSNISSTIYNLDIDGNLVDSILAGRQIVGLTVDPTTNTLWGSASSSATQYDLATGNQLSTIPVPTTSGFFAFLQSLAFDGTYLWFHAFSRSQVWQLDPTDGRSSRPSWSTVPSARAWGTTPRTYGPSTKTATASAKWMMVLAPQVLPVSGARRLACGFGDAGSETRVACVSDLPRYASVAYGYRETLYPSDLVFGTGGHESGSPPTL